MHEPPPPRVAPPPLPAAERELAERVREELWFGDDDPKRSHLAASRSMAIAAARAVGLKPFPVVAQRVMAMAADPAVELKTLEHTLEQDPALCSRLLRIVNSAAYRPVMPSVTVGQAVVRLGVRNVRTVTAGAALMGLFEDVHGEGSKMRDHSAQVAAIARLLGIEWNLPQTDDLYVGGLLHDIGKLLILQGGELDYSTLASSALTTADECHIHERALLGYDHAVLGAQVLSEWGLPDSLAQVVAWHHQPGRAYGAGAQLGIQVALLRIADRFAYCVNHTTRGAQLEPPLLEELAKDGAVSYADLSPSALESAWPRIVDAARDALQAFA